MEHSDESNLGAEVLGPAAIVRSVSAAALDRIA
jgi:hypothetical protein